MSLDWVQAIIKAAKEVAPKEFYGNVQLNIKGGKVMHVNVTQSLQEK